MWRFLDGGFKRLEQTQKDLERTNKTKTVSASSEYIGRKLPRSFEFIRAQLRRAQLALPSGLELDGGFFDTFHKTRTADPRHLQQQLRELDFVLDRLARAESTPIEERSWQDSVESWLALRDLLPEVQTVRAIKLLEVVFSDEDVLAALGLAERLLEILPGDETGNATPPALLTRLKTVLGGQMKRNYFLYVKTLEREKSSIERLISLQHRLFGLMATAATGIFIGIANLCCRVLYEEVWLVHV